MTAAPGLIVEFPSLEVPDAAAAQELLAAAREAAALAAARSVSLLLPEAADGGRRGLDPGILAGILTAGLRGPGANGNVTRPACAPPWLIVSASTSRNAPYNLARRIQSLNRITGGRVGLFLRTTGLDPITAGAAAVSAASGANAAAGDPSLLLGEYAEVLRRLWASFPEEALIGDREAGRFADPRSLAPASFFGDVYSVAGALNVPLPSAHRTLLLADAASAGPWAPVDGIIAADPSRDHRVPVPVYRTVTWLPAPEGVPAVATATGAVVAGTADDAARVLRDGPPAHTLLRVRAGAAQFATLLNALFEVLPEPHESRGLPADAR